ncbi:Rhomboid-like protein [Venustampulla echinocandica]|uniref:Rhomboid-type serine protease n=1 Tax=Venustampulla echinocandica TaxID=2656787 RepID=A0A370TW68_9HELO|nr:Rhomboid-like protein [Venustampulla echinocandica]RDL39762.1 Rhomboid-like protein [Venustampulla echinocandica]
MAANHYHDASQPEHSQTPQPYYQPYNAAPPQYRASPAPPDSSQPHSRAPSARPSDLSPVSPFEAPFDDHVYPMERPAYRYDSSSTLGQDSGRYAQGGGGRQDPADTFRDDIPMRDRPSVPPKDTGTDHVYDAGDPRAPTPLQTNPSLEDGRRSRKSGMGFFKTSKRIPWVVYTLTLIQVAVFIAEVVKNVKLTGSPIQIHPQFNPMIGPSPYVLINMGALYMPCMHNVKEVQGSNVTVQWPCPNTVSNDGPSCTLGKLCGFNFPDSWEPKYNGDVDQTPEPNQWYRFILPIFLHAGIIHIGFNMLLQMTIGREMEVIIGPIRFFLVYMASGIFGFVLGGNFAVTGIAATGASGSLFGVLALTILDLLYNWRERKSPWIQFTFIMFAVVISFVLGLLPGLDNFSHIGGFLMGLVLGICILHSPTSLQKRIGQDPPYTPINHITSDDTNTNTGITNFAKAPLGFFKGRKPAWWAWWLVRAASLVFVFIVFILLLNNFYKYKKTCSWCRYLSCINIHNWCDTGNLQFTPTNSTTNTTSKRSVFDTWDSMAKLY